MKLIHHADNIDAGTNLEDDLTKQIYITVGLVFASASAFACPDLTGNYVAASGNQRKELRMSKDAGGVFSLSDTGAPSLILNGESRDLDGQPGISYIGSCTQSEILIRIFQDSAEVGRMTYSQLPQGIRIQTSRFESSNEIYNKQ
jgi:hypothetical protein